VPARLTVAPDGTTMPGDQVEGRTWPLLLDETGRSTWYCRSIRLRPREELRAQIPWVEKRTGMAVRLPQAIDQPSAGRASGPLSKRTSPSTSDQPPVPLGAGSTRPRGTYV
jgi:hypothetical protein